jgi:hypothetical protein
MSQPILNPDHYLICPVEKYAHRQCHKVLAEKHFYCMSIGYYNRTRKAHWKKYAKELESNLRKFVRSSQQMELKQQDDL